MAKGDHLFVNASVRGIPYRHHGIDMGDGTVIHLAPLKGTRVALRDETEAFAVRRVSYEEFCLGAVPRVLVHENGRDPADVAASAESLLGKTGYSLLDGNCEHFATFCATGEANSHQIDMGEATVAALASMGTKAFWTVTSSLGTRAIVRGAVKFHPAALIADGIEIATLAAGCQSGLSSQRSRRLARVSGALAAAGIGGILGGPVGAVGCVAAHRSSSAIAERLCKSVRKALS